MLGRTQLVRKIPPSAAWNRFVQVSSRLDLTRTRQGWTKCAQHIKICSICALKSELCSQTQLFLLKNCKITSFYNKTALIVTASLASVSVTPAQCGPGGRQTQARDIMSILGPSVVVELGRRIHVRRVRILIFRLLKSKTFKAQFREEEKSDLLLACCIINGLTSLLWKRMIYILDFD